MELDQEKEIKAKRLQPDWSKAPSVEDLKGDIVLAKSDADIQKGKINVWLDYLKGTGEAAVKTSPGKSSVVPKLIRKQAEWKYTGLSEPFLSNGNKLFDCKPVTSEDKLSAFQNSLIINNQFSTVINKVKFMDSLVRRMVNEGTAIVRTGWHYEGREVTKEVPNYEYKLSVDPDFHRKLAELRAIKEQNPADYQQADDALKKSLEYTLEVDRVYEAILVGTRTETETEVTANYPTVELVEYQNIVVDPTCGDDLSKAGFLEYSFESSISELKKTNKYQNLDAVNVDNSSTYDDPDFDSNGADASFRYKDNSRKKLIVKEYWGYWDINDDGQTVPIIAVYVGSVMIMLEKNPFPDKAIPFTFIQYLPVKDSLYGEPDGELLKDNQRVAGAVTRGMLDIMGKSAAGQRGYREGSLDAVNKTRFLNGLDYQFTGINDPSKAFYAHTYPVIPESAGIILNQQNAEAESLSGVKAFSSGITGNSLGDTASNGKSALDAAAKREMGILRRITEGLVEVARKIVAMNAIFLSEEEVVRVTNREFVTIRRDDLPGNFDLAISVSTPEADEAKAEQLAFMLQTTGQTMGGAFSQLILSEIATLRKMPDLADKIANYQPQPDPLAQKKAELEIQLLEAQIENEQQTAIKNNSSAQLDLARADTEGAKAGNLNSDTDLKDLNFVETETGTIQARQLELQRTQNSANERIKVLDQKLKSDSDDVKTTNGIRAT